MKRKVVSCLFSFFVISLLSARFAFAHTYQIEARQVGTDGWVYKTICETGEYCELAMGIIPLLPGYEGDMDVTIGVMIVDETQAYLQFQTPYGFLQTKAGSARPRLTLQEKGSVEKTLALYRAHPTAARDPANGLAHLGVVRPAPEKLADISLKARRLPN